MKNVAYAVIYIAGCFLAATAFAYYYVAITSCCR